MKRTIATLVLGAALATPLADAQQAPAAPPQAFNVKLAPGMEPTSGRLIVTATPASLVRPGYYFRMPTLAPSVGSYVAAQETQRIGSDKAVRFDADLIAFPKPLSQAEPGEYWVQVLLDRNHNAAYKLNLDGDPTTAPVKMMLPTSAPIEITLGSERDVTSQMIAEAEAAARNAPPRPAPATPRAAPSPEALAASEEKARQRQAEADQLRAEAAAHLKPLEFQSPSLTAFWGRPIVIRGHVLTPPGYDEGKQRYPTVYRTEGFGWTLNLTPNSIARRHYELMKRGETPPMIRVFLDHSFSTGTHEFADSVNNGPWGKALTEELIPYLEKQYRMDAKPSGRFTTGHSSGGWFAIWQQVRYPNVFGGAWARAPDPVDFRSFTGVDIYRANANAYVRPDGSAQYLVRDQAGKETESLRDYAQQEAVLGDIGGQFASFNAVFSPRGPDGRPMKLFDTATGQVDPAVAEYWKQYDISLILRTQWPKLKPKLDGRINLIMGDNDTYHLNEAAALLEQELNQLGAKANFLWIKGGTHGNLDRYGGDEIEPCALEKRIALEMYRVARPGTTFKPAATPPRAGGLGMPAC